MPLFDHLTHPLTSIPWGSEMLNHFRSLLLDAEHSDVQILCFGHLYRLHRVILCRIDFFKTLIDGPWRESRSRRDGAQAISITFPPPINRAVFELCLSRIYGTGPKVVPPPWAALEGEPLILGRTHALIAQATGIELNVNVTEIRPEDERDAWTRLLKDENAHPAPPSFLIPLLACADYLGMSNLVKETTDLIMTTITPFTVMSYLNFSLGKPSQACSLGSNDELGCRSLESLGSPVSVKIEDAALGQIEEQEDVGELCRGALTDRLGKACASWLSKWGSDLLILEERLTQRCPLGQVESLASEDELEFTERWPCSRRPPMQIWGCHGGLSSDWVRVLISSDAFFLPKLGDEWERYRFATRVTQLRERERVKSDLISQATDEHDHELTTPSVASVPDQELVRMFHDGIYYSHMVCVSLFRVLDHLWPASQLHLKFSDTFFGK